MARKPQRKPPKPAPHAKTARKPGQSIGGDLFVNPHAVTSTGRVDKTVNKQITALPFVRKSKRGEGHCFWSVTPTGNYTKDYGQGLIWARRVLPLLKYNVGPVLLSWIVVDMIKAGERNGLVLGFVRDIGHQLQVARSDLLVAAIATLPKPPIAANRKAWLECRKVLNNSRLKLLRRLADAI
jgi:hypothetical protein